MVLVLKSIIRDYTGESLVVPILKVLNPKEWNFMKKLGFFMIDNTPNNSTMIKALLRGNTHNSLGFRG